MYKNEKSQNSFLTWSPYPSILILTEKLYTKKIKCKIEWWCHPTISSSVIPFSSCLQSSPTSGSFPMSQFLASGGQSIGVSASASVLPMNIQDWFPLGWTGWISLQSKEFSRDLSNTTVQKHQFFGAQLFIAQLSHPYMTTGKTIALTRRTPSVLRWGFPGGSVVKNQETWIRSLGWEDPLEKETATHSSILRWKIPWTEEPLKITYSEILTLKYWYFPGVANSQTQLSPEHSVLR